MARPIVRLIREAELQAPLDLLAAHGAPAGELLAQANLPERAQAPRDGFLPARHLLRFFACGARYLDLEDFAFQAVLGAPGSHIGSWGRMIPRCWRLRDALRCFTVQLVRDAPFLEAGVHYGDDHAWLWRSRDLPPKDPRDELQGEMYTLGSMLQVVRAAAGPSWHPPAVLAESDASDWLLGNEALGDSTVHFGGRVLAIAVPHDMLDLRLARGTPSHPIHAGDQLQPATDLAGSLQQACTPLVGVVPLSLEIAAEIAETSPRTLRRRLSEEGTSWRRIVDRIRFEMAEERLREPTVSVAEIAAELRYTDNAHFTRAFRRWTGESPSSYRRRRWPTRQPSAPPTLA